MKKIMKPIYNITIFGKIKRHEQRKTKTFTI